MDGALIINFSGIGNGFQLLPILRCIERERGYRIYHIENAVFREPFLLEKAEISPLAGFVPAKWRRFHPDQWEAIRTFAAESAVKLIINLRNEGPEFDRGYFGFKERFAGEFEFWDLFDSGTNTSTTLIGQRIVEILQNHGVPTEHYDPRWLASVRRSKRYDKKTVAFCVGASRPGKRWKLESWIELGFALPAINQYEIAIFSGITQVEVKLARRLFRELAKGNLAVKLVPPSTSLSDFVVELSSCDALIGNDSFPIHVAAAIGIPTIGLYFGTDANVWGGNSTEFRHVQSRLGLKCRHMREATGNCRRFYSGCGRKCGNQSDVRPRDVASKLRSLLPPTVNSK